MFVSRSRIKAAFNILARDYLFLNQNKFPAWTSVFILRKMSMQVAVPLESIPKVEIDDNGVFKFILMKVYDKSDDERNIIILRGYHRCLYHSDIYEEVQEKLYPLDCDPMGGGRISHEAEAKKIHIYGYSQGYGQSDHELAAKLIKEFYPEYKITISNDGY